MLENLKNNKEFDMIGKIKYKTETEQYKERNAGTPQIGMPGGVNTWGLHISWDRDQQTAKPLVTVTN